ncbi:hypothetical protein ACFLZM_01165 [Thermodesulfobacteriota bacterium]
MADRDLYGKAHLLVAAIRVLEHQNKIPPAIEDICRVLSFTVEQGGFICRKLETMGIINVVEGAYGARLVILNHLKLEEIPKDIKEDKFEEALKKFQTSKKEFTQKMESFQAKQAEKQKNLFADLEKQLKKELNKK